MGEASEGGELARACASDRGAKDRMMSLIPSGRTSRRTLESCETIDAKCTQEGPANSLCMPYQALTESDAAFRIAVFEPRVGNQSRQSSYVVRDGGGEAVSEEDYYRPPGGAGPHRL